MRKWQFYSHVIPSLGSPTCESERPKLRGRIFFFVTLYSQCRLHTARPAVLGPWNIYLNYDWRFHFHHCCWEEISSPSAMPHFLSSCGRHFLVALLSKLTGLSDLHGVQVIQMSDEIFRCRKEAVPCESEHSNLQLVVKLLADTVRIKSGNSAYPSSTLTSLLEKGGEWLPKLWKRAQRSDPFRGF
jgi:hypothetical protein